MVVQHNLQAINANRMLNVTTTSQGKATEKLSSGYQINRAADNAAGLAISEKMRKQIRGLDQASTNAQDGVSAVQTAEGALNEVHSMLQRMNELAVQAANGTNSESDRESIQDEIAELTTEIDRVSETTKFNETELLKGSHGVKTKILKGHDAGINGTFVDSVTVASLSVNLKSGTTITVAGQRYNIVRAIDIDKASNISSVETAKDTAYAGTPINDCRDKIEVIQDAIDHVRTDKADASKVTINGTTYVRTMSADGTTAVWTAGTGNEYTNNQLKEKVVDGATIVLDLEDMGSVDTAGTFTSIGSAYVSFMKGTYIARDYTNHQSNKTAREVGNLVSNAMVQANCIGVDAESVGSVNVKVKDPNVTTPHTSGEYDTLDKLIDKYKSDQTKLNNLLSNPITFRVEKGYATIPNMLSFNLHVGADADMGNKIIVDIDGMTTAGLGIQNLNVADDSGIAATYAIDAIADALQVVSAQRASLGAIQNRLEHTISNLDNVVENTTAAESRIRDTDMAEEMVEYSKNNILTQAGQSMLAQANQSTQGVLSLLQG